MSATSTFLHVGCGRKDKSATTRVFAGTAWREIRLDIDPGVRPEIVNSMVAMTSIPSGSVDAVFSSHNIEHLYPHEVPLAMREFLRVLKPGGHAVVTCPDLRAACERLLKTGADQAAYTSPAGPVAPLDILYGHRASIAEGHTFMAHRYGFTQETLVAALLEAGFQAVASKRRPGHYDLWAVGVRDSEDQAAAARLAQAHFPA